MERMELKSESDKKNINTMHEYLGIFRKLSKYSTEELGDEIGVSKSTIANFERNVERIRMSKAQYLALRTVLEARAEELEKKEKDDSLKNAIKLVFYNTEYEANKTKIKERLTTAGKICGVAGSLSVGTILAPLLPMISGATLLGTGIGIASFILKGLKDKEKG